MFTYQRLAIVGMFLSVGWMLPDRAAAQEKPPKEIDAKTTNAWWGKNAKVGYMGVDASGQLAFADHQDGLRDAVPAFRCRMRSFSVAELRGLPHPKVPFGLWLEGEGPPDEQLTGPPSPVEELAGLEHLTHLRLIGQRFQNPDLEGLSELKSLTHLDLRWTWVSGADLKHLGGLKSLTYLNLHQTAVPGPWLKHLSGLEQLTELHVDCVADKDLRHVAGLKNLTQLSIRPSTHRSPLLTAEGLKHLAGMQKLKRLVLLISEMSDEGWAQLRAIPHLTSLALPGLQAKTSVVKQLGEFKALEGLSIRPPEQAEDLKHLAGMKKITRLELPGTPVTDEIMKHLVELPGLTSLRIGGDSGVPREMTEDGLRRLADIKNLTDLSLGKGVTDKHLQQLARLSNLTRLELECSLIQGHGLKHLGELSKLTSLTLRVTPRLGLPKFNETEVLNLKKALPNCKVVIHRPPER